MQAETPDHVNPSGPHRRSLLIGAVTGAGAVGAGAAVAAAVGAATSSAPPGGGDQDAARDGKLTEPFYGARQAGVSTNAQAFGSFIAFTLNGDATKDSVRRMLRVVSEDAAELTQGRAPITDQEPWLAENPSRLTVTVGFGPRLMRIVAPGRTPQWLKPLPKFGIDRLEEQWNQGDLLLQLCCDDPLTLAHAKRVLLKNVRSFAKVKWVQDGFRTTAGGPHSGGTPRNLFGQLDGTVNPVDEELEKVVYGKNGFTPWMEDGTSLVIRRIHMNVDTWDEVDTPAREDSVGRKLDTGAPLTGTQEHDEPDFEAKGPLGFHIIPSYSHMRRARGTDPDQKIHRRVYNYDLPVANASGHNRAGEVSGGVSNSGLIFASYQADPAKQFVPMQKRLDELDMLNTWTVPIGSAVFAIPPGCQPGGFVGDVVFT